MGWNNNDWIISLSLDTHTSMKLVSLSTGTLGDGELSGAPVLRAKARSSSRDIPLSLIRRRRLLVLWRGTLKWGVIDLNPHVQQCTRVMRIQRMPLPGAQRIYMINAATDLTTHRLETHVADWDCTWESGKLTHTRTHTYFLLEGSLMLQLTDHLYNVRLKCNVSSL